MSSSEWKNWYEICSAISRRLLWLLSQLDSGLAILVNDLDDFIESFGHSVFPIEFRLISPFLLVFSCAHYWKAADHPRDCISLYGLCLTGWRIEKNQDCKGLEFHRLRNYKKNATDSWQVPEDVIKQGWLGSKLETTRQKKWS